MVINRNSVVGRWYFRWIALGGNYGYQPDQENLCHLVRVLLVYAPVRWFFSSRERGKGDRISPFQWCCLSVLGLLGLAIIVFHPWKALMVTAMAIGLGLLVWLIVTRRPFDPFDIFDRILSSSMFQVASGYVAAKKQKICPLVTFTKKDS